MIDVKSQVNKVKIYTEARAIHSTLNKIAHENQELDLAIYVELAHAIKNAENIINLLKIRE